MRWMANTRVPLTYMQFLSTFATLSLPGIYALTYLPMYLQSIVFHFISFPALELIAARSLEVIAVLRLELMRTSGEAMKRRVVAPAFIFVLSF